MRAWACSIFCAALLLAPAALAEIERPAIVVTPGAPQVYRVAVQRFAQATPAAELAPPAVEPGEGGGTTAATEAPALPDARVFRERLLYWLEFSGIFEGIDEAAYLGPEVSSAEPRCSDWSQIGADALVAGEFAGDAERLDVVFRIWDTARCVVLREHRYRQARGAEIETPARRIADDAVAAFIGRRGVADTEIAFVSDRGGNKEIYVMSADGSRVRAATANGSRNNFPDWSPDANAIVYTSYRLKNRPLLFLSTRGRGKPGLVLPDLVEKRDQYRGVFSPGGDELALVLSNGGETDIFRAELGGEDLRRLRGGRAIQVSPSWSPDAEQVAFVSDRSGSPQIYVIDADGTDMRRLTFDGVYNASPAWSPDGLWIAYATLVNGQFDIWLCDPQTGESLPLVTHPRSDESPSWAPNGRKLVFSSKRRGRADLYVIDRDGANLRRITRDAGNNTSPDWGPFRN
ncbi:MAG: PD40 domain-containing protein [Myxococcales bacterium]|nr:PD40 domain-containing protein [Myxococcales bacterium]